VESSTEATHALLELFLVLNTEDTPDQALKPAVLDLLRPAVLDLLSKFSSIFMLLKACHLDDSTITTFL
jgi:hypothetical protein